MGCGCGQSKKRQVVNKVSQTTKTANQKKPVNNSNKNEKRNSRLVKIQAINKSLTKK